MSQHTPEPWDYDGGSCGEIIAGTPHKPSHGLSTAQLVAVAALEAGLNDSDEHPDRSEEEMQANAYRIVTCVNACKGIKDPVKAIPLLLAALEAYEAAIQAMHARNGVLHLVPGMHLFLPHEQARAALAAAKGN